MHIHTRTICETIKMKIHNKKRNWMTQACDDIEILMARMFKYIWYAWDFYSFSHIYFLSISRCAFLLLLLSPPSAASLLYSLYIVNSSQKRNALHQISDIFKRSGILEWILASSGDQIINDHQNITINRYTKSATQLSTGPVSNQEWKDVTYI